VAILSKPILKNRLAERVLGPLILLTRAGKNVLALRLGCQLRNGLEFEFISAFTIYHLRHSHFSLRLSHSPSPAYNRLRIQPMSHFASVGAMFSLAPLPTMHLGATISTKLITANLPAS
jgi:hypothetical protein